MSAVILASGALGTLVAGLVEFRFNKETISFRYLLRSTGNGRWRYRWTLYAAFECAVGLIFAIPLVYVIPTDHWWSLPLGVLVPFLTSPIVARTRFVTITRTSVRPIYIGINGPYGWLRGRFRRHVEEAHQAEWNRWVEELRRYSDEGKAPQPHNLATWIHNWARQDARNYGRPEVREVLRRMEEIADEDDPAIAIPDRYEGILRLIPDLGMRGAATEAQKMTVMHIDTPASQTTASRGLFWSALQAITGILALIGASGIVGFILPEGDPPRGPSVQTENESVVPEGPNKLQMRLSIQGLVLPDHQRARCRGVWQLTEGSRTSRQDFRDGELSGKIDLGVGEIHHFSSTVTIRDPEALGEWAILEIRASCDREDGSSFQSTPRTYRLTISSWSIQPTG